jgi:hypothetical protein
MRRISRRFERMAEFNTNAACLIPKRLSAWRYRAQEIANDRVSRAE